MTMLGNDRKFKLIALTGIIIAGIFWLTVIVAICAQWPIKEVLMSTPAVWSIAGVAVITAASSVAWSMAPAVDKMPKKQRRR